MHQPANTMDGRYGFMAIYPDGSFRTEFDFLWDELPMDKPIKTLRMIDTWQNVAVLELSGFNKFYFSNEALAGAQFDHPIKACGRMYLPPPGQNFMLTAKIFGAFDYSQGATEIRVDVKGEMPKGMKWDYPIKDCPFAPHACRPGVPK